MSDENIDDVPKVEPDGDNTPDKDLNLIMEDDAPANSDTRPTSLVEPEDIELEPNGNHTKPPMDDDNGNIAETAVDMDKEESNIKRKLSKIERARAREALFFEKDGDRQRIDYVLAYAETTNEEKNTARRFFEDNLADDGLALEYEDKSKSVDGKTFYVKLSADWESLATGAELMNMKKKLKMPKGAEPSSGGCCSCSCTNCCVVPDDIVHEDDDFFTMAFSVSLIDHFDIDMHDPESVENFFTNAERSLIVGEILNRTAFTAPESQEVRFGIHKMINDGIYAAAFPLHEGRYRPLPDETDPFTGRDKDRARLYEAWARPGRWYCYQPLDLIRKYFGEKIGIYFAWLGFYTGMLIPASIAGVAVFLYGLATMFSDPPSNEICDKGGVGNFTMCPQCDERCSYWRLHETSCLYSRITYVFDNIGSVAMATFMSVWAVCFLEFWKRKQKELEYDWDVANYEAEERMRPEFEFKVKKAKENPITNLKEPYLPFYSKCPRTCTSWSIVLFMIMLVALAIFGIIVYRIVIVILLYSVDFSLIKQYAKIITSLTAACVNLIIIMILSLIYKQIAMALTEMELHRTETDFEDSYTSKMFLFQFVNTYGTTFYVAFFKGSFIGKPGTREFYLFGQFQQDACDPAGCMVDLFLQIALVMVGKQFLNNAKELLVPLLKNCFRRRGVKDKETDENLFMRWEQDHSLEFCPRLGLFEEYLEMVIQFGFVTIFVAAFPLAPLFALINNIIEIRLDAYKFVCVYRRGAAVKAQDIGAWYSILKTLSFVAVLSNAFIISWTSEFIPKLVYKFTGTSNGTLHGYIDYSLSHFSTQDFLNGTAPDDPGVDEFGVVTDCRYIGHRFPPDAPKPYEYTLEHWYILCARLACVIVFEHACYFFTWLIASLIPDVPASVKRLQVYEKQLVKKMHFDSTFTAMKDRRKSRMIPGSAY